MDKIDGTVGNKTQVTVNDRVFELFAVSGETVVIKQVVGNCGGNQALTTMFAISFLDKNGTLIKNDIKSRSKSRKQFIL